MRTTPSPAQVDATLDKWKIYLFGALLTISFGAAIYMLQRELARYDDTSKEIRATIGEIKIGLKGVESLDAQYKLQQKVNEENNRRLEESVRDLNRRMEGRPVTAPLLAK
ncbi:MAG: hypothetical protein EOO70_02340 [Myxococcaceae bacterium]|nr:MAG: hypothetical protein EOO70_02340 [Myxococcaceae bacterium]